MKAEDLLYPRTRFQVLRTLNYSEAAISLHEIAERAELVIGSVQTAVRWLLEAKIVSAQKLNNRTCYQIKNQSAIELVTKLHELLEPIELAERAAQYQSRASKLLADIEDRNTLIAKARKSMKL